MNGELDFAGSLRERVATLRGVDSVFGDVLATITTTKRGATRLIDAVHAAEWAFRRVSGGFEGWSLPSWPPSASASTPQTGWRSRTAFSRATMLGRIVTSGQGRMPREWASSLGVSHGAHGRNPETQGERHPMMDEARGRDRFARSPRYVSGCRSSSAAMPDLSLAILRWDSQRLDCLKVSRVSVQL